MGEDEKKYITYCRQLFQGICRGEVVMEEILDERGVLLNIKVGKADMPLVIGVGGRHVAAIRTLVHAAGRAEGEKVSVKIIEPALST